jgi:ubiquinone/menaquinone biosynthesis C-methylase UbiE
MEIRANQKAIANYYSRPSSRIGYALLLRKAKHFSYYDKDHVTEWTAQDNYHQKFLKLLDIKPGMQIMDAGCGVGVVASYVAKQSGADVLGVTITPFEIKAGPHNAQQYGVANHVTFMLADYSASGLPDASFDRIYSIETLCHSPNIQKAIQEFWRLLKPGGKLILGEYELDLTRFGSDEQRAMEILIDTAGGFGVNQMGLGQFKKYCQTAGFTDFYAEDWTEGIRPSIERLARLAKPLKDLAVLLHAERMFINPIIAYMYGEALKRQEFFYKAFTATKPSTAPHRKP